ncbi:hypothetical protein DINM_002474 [Dirofilaria immitis]|nr:hypothetical protein [Dirofilaria immitis]
MSLYAEQLGFSYMKSLVETCAMDEAHLPIRVIFFEDFEENEESINLKTQQSKFVAGRHSFLLREKWLRDGCSEKNRRCTSHDCFSLIFQLSSFPAILYILVHQ